MINKPSTPAAGSAARSESVTSAANPALVRVREVGLILAGTVALILIVGGYLILRRRRQEG